MRFVIFSPMSTASAIGRVTALLVTAFAHRGHTVIVVRTENASYLPSQPHACEAHVVRWTDGEAVTAALHDADHVLYQIGDNHPFHCGALHWLPSVPGIVCLHDFFVANLFYDWARERRDEAERVLAKWYGEAAPTDFFGASNSEEFLEKASTLYPMTEWICEMAHGVVSHSHWGMPRVARACAGPVRVLPLPYDAPGALPPGPSEEAERSTINILTVGHANANKRIESVIRVIGSSTLLRARVVYRLCGAIDTTTGLALAALARDLNVNLLVSGKTDDEALQRAWHDADIVSCLRWPSLEAASATAIEALLYGKAVIVTNTGFYADLPGDLVRKISPENEAGELRETLEFLCTNPDARLAMGRRGQAWASTTFDAGRYADQLLHIFVCVAASAPRIRLADYLSTQMAHWGATPALMAASNLTPSLELLFRS